MSPLNNPVMIETCQRLVLYTSRCVALQQCSIDKTGLKEYTYTYRDNAVIKLRECNIAVDVNGDITSRTRNGITTYNYELEGSKIVKVTCGENVIIPLYDNNDSPIGIIHNGKFYWYAKNLQGDILAIRDETDYDVVRYNYDAWGKVQVNRDYSGCNLALLNPFLYRGYVYDYETKLYYLQSRYYDPDTGRFINPDEPTFIGAGSFFV